MPGRHPVGQFCFLAQWLANNKKQPCGFMGGCIEDHGLVVHPAPARAMVNVLWTIARGGKCRFCGHQNDPEVMEEGGNNEYCGNGEGGGDIGLSLLFGDPSDSRGAAGGGEIGATMTLTDLDPDLDPGQRRDLDIDMTDMDMDNGTEAALQGAVRAVRGSQVKLTFRDPAHSTWGASLHDKVTVAAKRMMVEGIPANAQYDTGAKVCLITTEMVARLGLLRHRESS